MLTIFTSPKPFRDHIGIIQRNALGSWRALPGCEVLIFGEDEGAAEAAAANGFVHVPEVARSPSGVPLVNDLFEKAKELARNDVLCFVNADVILTSSLLQATKLMESRQFLIVGQRWDLDVPEELAFEDGWERELLERVSSQGQLHPPMGSDYFVFRRDVSWHMPPFAVGRVRWDNWTLGRALDLSMDVIDATRVVMVVHQKHDHAPSQQLPGRGRDEAPEQLANARLAGNSLYTLADVTHVLTAEGLIRVPSRPSGAGAGGVVRRVARRVSRTVRGLPRKHVLEYARCRYTEHAASQDVK